MCVFGYRAHQGPSGYAEGICVEQDAVTWKGMSVSGVRATPKSALFRRMARCRAPSSPDSFGVAQRRPAISLYNEQHTATLAHASPVGGDGKALPAQFNERASADDDGDEAGAKQQRQHLEERHADPVLDRQALEADKRAEQHERLGRGRLDLGLDDGERRGEEHPRHHRRYHRREAAHLGARHGLGGRHAERVPVLRDAVEALFDLCLLARRQRCSRRCQRRFHQARRWTQRDERKCQRRVCAVRSRVGGKVGDEQRQR
ncbi:hypothetical protein L1887_56794 [Cichorium endivia]|nr:hypothetical protein L1887_56794 [Cichorium endivia]